MADPVSQAGPRAAEMRLRPGRWQRWYRLLPWVLIGIGVALRVIRYLHNRALWGDEAALALNLVHRSPRELLEPLDFDQAAPILFLLAEKLVVQLFGESELALRALPLLAGVASLVLFWIVARRVLQPLGALTALALFAVVDPLVFYSAEVKQYGLDVVVALVIFALILPVLEGAELNRARVIGLVVVGAAAVWLSHSSVFTLAGAGLALLALSWVRPQQVSRAVAAGAALVWGASFLLSYFLVLPNTQTVQDELRLAGGAEGEGRRLAVDILAASWDSFAYPLGLAATSTALAAVLLLIGCLPVYRRNPLALLALLAPGVLGLAAALLDRYPWGERFVLFFVPPVILLIGAGLHEVVRRTWRWTPLVPIAVFGLLFAYPVGVAAEGVVSPAAIKRQELKEPLRFLDARWQDGDVLYVHEIAQYALRYYAECNECGVLEGWAERLQAWGALTDIDSPGGASTNRPAIASSRPDIIVGAGLRPSFEDLTAQLSELRGRARVWVLFSTTTNQDFLLYLLDSWGKQLEVVTRSEAALYLYDLRSGSS